MPEKNKNHRKTMRTERIELKTENTKPKDNKVSTEASINLTPEERAIATRAMAETDEWEPIREDELNDFSLQITPLELKHNFPEAWKEQVEKRYAFRWCERIDKRIDELTRGGHPVTRWKICTRNTTPVLAHYVDNVLGCIARLDQVLLFRPWDRHMMEKRAKEQLTEARVNSGKPENIVMRRASDKIEAYSGPKYKIGSTDEVQYEDLRQDAEVEEIVVENKEI
uniref:Uncharacterized protein n=1 Tax=viral metagenome TaxID=1070528 RepID=A0A6H1ZM87_9ZZZZ